MLGGADLRLVGNLQTILNSFSTQRAMRDESVQIDFYHDNLRFVFSSNFSRIKESDLVQEQVHRHCFLFFLRLARLAQGAL